MKRGPRMGRGKGRQSRIFPPAQEKCKSRPDAVTHLNVKVRAQVVLRINESH